MNKSFKNGLWVLTVGAPFYAFASQTTSTPSSTLNISGLTIAQQSALTNAAANPVLAAQTLQQDHVTQANYFFSRLPQATTLPQTIIDEINRIYSTGLGIPSTIITHIIQFYSLLYLIAEEELLAQSIAAPTGANSLPTQIINGIPQLQSPLTGPQLLASKVWQDYLKIKIAYSYVQETQFLQQIQQNELDTFKYLPQFEFNFYQNTFVQLRILSQLTRFYLLMTERLRERYIAQCVDWNSIVTATDSATALSQRNSLFKAIEDFKNGDFYQTTMKFESIDPESTTVLSPQPTYSQFPSIFSITNGVASVSSGYAPFFEIDSTGKVLLTGLGSLIYTGYIVSPQNSRPYFETTPLFQKLFVSTTQSNGTTTITPTLGYMELLCFSAIKALHAETAYLFNTANLSDTLQKIKNIGSSTIPNIIFYQPSDYMFLSEINRLLTPLNNNTVAPNAVVPTCAKKIVSGIKSVANTVAHFGSDLYTEAIDPALNTIAHAGKALANEVESVALYVAVPALEAVDAFSGTNLSSWALHTAQDAQAAAVKNLNSAMTDLGQTMAGIKSALTSVAEVAATGLAYATGGILLAFDKKYAQDYINMFKKVADTAVDIVMTQEDFVVQRAGESVMLTADAVNALASTVGDVVSGNTGGLGSEWKQFGEDIASSILSTVTLVAKDVSTGLSDAMTAIGYLVSSIVDMIDDIGAAVAAAGQFILTALETGSLSSAAGAASSTFSSTYDAIDAHRKLISGIVTTALIVALTVATGGAGSALGAGLLAINVGMMAMNVAGDAQQDAIDINQKAQESDFVARYGAYVNANKTDIQNITVLQTASEQGHFAAALENQNRSLAFYQNWSNDMLNNTVSAQAYSLGSFYNYRTQYQVDSQNNQASPLLADPGFSYGIKTGRMVLNPGSGFLVYNQARQTFGQEVAAVPTYPQIVSLPPDNLGTSKVQGQLNWFTLKDLVNIPVAGQPDDCGGVSNGQIAADVLFRSLYDAQQPFYIGVYLTERSIDIDEMNTLNKNITTILSSSSATGSDFSSAWSQLDIFNRQLLDFDTQAKMFVVYRSQAPGKSVASVDSRPKLGVYVHNTTMENTQNGWLQSPLFAPITFNQGAWYRMQAKLVGSALTVSFWPVDDTTSLVAFSTPPTTAQIQTFTVDNAKPFASILNPLKSSKYAGSMGFIASGSAVEYKVIAPCCNPVIFPSAGPRAQSDAAVQNLFQNSSLLEKDREKIWQDGFEKGLTIVMNPYTLTAYKESLMLVGQNIYTIASTNTSKGTLNDMTDYVVLAQDIHNTPFLGVSAMQQPNGFVSLVTGAMYYVSGGAAEYIGTLSDVIKRYQADAQVTIDNQTLGIITAAQTTFKKGALAQPYSFAANVIFTLDQNSLNNNVYIYQGPAMPATASKKTDYYMFVSGATTASPMGNQPITPNLLSERIDGLISLTTNKIFLLQQAGQSGTSGSTVYTLPNPLSGASSLMVVLTAQEYNVYVRYASQMPVSIASLVSNALTMQSEEDALSAAQTILSNAQSQALSAQAALDKATTSLSILGIDTALKTQTTTDQSSVQVALNTINSFITQLSQLIATAKSFTSATSPDTITTTTTNLKSLNTQVITAVNSLGSAVNALMVDCNAIASEALNAQNSTTTQGFSSDSNNPSPSDPTCDPDDLCCSCGIC